MPPSRVDSRGYCWPRLATIPMGWGPAPGVCQGAHEAILYGEKGDGSDTARALMLVLDPAARWSSVSVPELDTAAAAAPHALIVDDLLFFSAAQAPPPPRTCLGPEGWGRRTHNNKWGFTLVGRMRSLR